MSALYMYENLPDNSK